MKFEAAGPALLDVCVLAACWIGFGVILVMGKRGAAKKDAKRNPISALGFALQALGYAICFSFPRHDLAPIVAMPKAIEWLLALTVAGIGIVSVAICYTAARTLGKQWALVARVTEGHELITEGPYAHVRNPIYLAMFGMLVATGLTMGRPPCWFFRSLFISAPAAGLRARLHLSPAGRNPRFHGFRPDAPQK